MAFIIVVQSLVFLFIISANGQQITNKLCTATSSNDACQQIARDQVLRCQTVSSITDCILDIDQGEPTLSTLKPEESFLAAGLVSENVRVIAEVNEENPPYETAVIVRQPYTGGFDALKGLKFCHPGYDHQERVTRYVLDELDWKVISLNCSTEELTHYTLTEEKVRGLAEFFGSSCRPGKWTEDTEFDAHLKSKYSSLCQLCGSSSCNVRYLAPFNDSLTCLSDGGDVALTTVKYAEEFLNYGMNSENFQYLCTDGSVSLSSTPCSWTKQLNKVLVTSSGATDTMVTYIQSKLSSYISGVTPGVTEQHLGLLLELQTTDRLNVLSEPVPLQSYVSERRPIPQNNSTDVIKCGSGRIMWSVKNDVEKSKCEWLKQASVTHGLYPLISCVKSDANDTLSSLDSMETSANLAFIDANFGYIARRKNLTNVGYPETDTRKLNKIVIVVRNDSTWYSSLTDLKGKSICLPEYGGKEWLAFIDLLRSKKILADSTDYGSIFSDFVGDSCAAGANSKDIDIPNTNYEKLCSRCYPIDDTLTSKYCNADSNNKYYDSVGALRCLEENNGDYAVLALNDLPRSIRNNATAEQQFKVVSTNGSLAAYPGFQVDEEAAIAIIVAGELVYKVVEPSYYNDTILYLRHMEVEFGLNLEKAFKVFDSFNHTQDLLFPDSTPGLTFDGSSNKYISKYRELLENSEKSVNTTSGASGITIFTVLVIGLVTIAARIG